ncbi:MAG: type VI secretion system tip protein VgrG [Rhizobacter sp.]|nr:type VI secretion system tip protein VgrG [Burkholderiales bacterium]
MSNERLIDADTPHGKAMWFRQMTGTEALSIPFEYDVTFHSLTSGLSAKAMLGQSVTLKLETQDGAGVRPFNGICTRFASGGREGEHLVYTAKLRPWLWIAGRRSDCKIFQFKTVPEIIEDVLGKYGFPMKKRLSKTYRAWDYCVQYQETDLNFVMRLAEHEGIYFYFEHAEGSHELVFIDDINTHTDLAGAATIPYFGADAAAVVRKEHFNSWDVREEVDSGEYIADDYDFKHPKANLRTNRKHTVGHDHDKWERYTWPGGYTKVGEGESYAKSNIETLQAEQERVQGHCTVRTMAPGFSFTLENCPRADQNRKYLAVAATYFFRNNAVSAAGGGDGDSAWGITVTSQPTSVPYRPQVLTPKPLTSGPQTAMVVGPAGEEIYTDEYGRVKVHFYWDRYDKKNQDSSCWIRVSQPWAGEKWGFIHIPRIGQEVIVDFIGGDPDYPIITGRVYNADQMPPYDLPANKTASGIKSRSTMGGSSCDFNEIRMEDLKGKEQLYVHAQRNLDTVVETDESRMVGHDRSTRINHDDNRFVVNDDRHVIQANQTHQIDGNQDTKVKANQSTTVDGNQSSVVHGDRTQAIDGKLNEETGGDHLETVKGKHNFAVSGDENNIISGKQINMIKGDRTALISGDDSYTTSGKTAVMATTGYSVSTGMEYAETCKQRSAMVYTTDDTKIMGKQTEIIGGMRSTNIVGSDQTTIGGAQTTSVAGASALTAVGTVSISAGGALSITGAAAVTVAGLTITVTAATINLVGTVNVIGMLNVAGVTTLTGATTVVGVLTSTSIVSPVYSPGLGNIL